MSRRILAAAIIVTLSALTSCSASNETSDIKIHAALVEYPDLSMEEILTGVERWIPELFQSAKVTLQHSDRETGNIAAKGVWLKASEYAPSHSVDIHFTLSVDVEEEKAQYRLTSLEAFSSDDHNKLVTVENSYQFHLDAENKFQSMVKTLSTAITAKASDW